MLAPRSASCAASVGEAWARLALALRGEGDPAACGARWSARQRLGSQAGDGSFGGDVNATALGRARARRSRPRAAARAARWLVADPGTERWLRLPGRRRRRHRHDRPGQLGAGAAGRRAAVSRAAAFVRSAQAADGGFPAPPGGESNAQSTGLATDRAARRRRRAAALAGRIRRARSARLPRLARPPRRLDRLPAVRSSPTPAWTTAQALLGLTATGAGCSTGTPTASCRLNTLEGPRLRWRHRP